MDREEEDLLPLVDSALNGPAGKDWRIVAEEGGPEDCRLLARLEEVRRIAEFHRLLQTSDSGLAPGETWGRLRILHVLGSGAFADVYQAHDSKLDRDVALKLYRERPLGDLPRSPGGMPVGSRDTEGSGDRGEPSEDRTIEADPSQIPVRATLSPSRVASLLHEARLMARVRHPNVIVIHGAEEIEGQGGIWMEWIQGSTLEERLEREGPLSAGEASLVALDLCRALAAVHAAGILHRDVKARNVMRERGGRTVLMDFGVGQDFRVQGPDATRDLSWSAGEVSGTPLYMAPEILLDGSASIASDVYSLGVLLFRLVTGSYPVMARDLGELAAAHRSGRRRLLRDIRPDIPAAFADAVEKALSPSPHDRYSSMGEMERAFQATVGLRASPVTEHPRRTFPVHRQITFDGRALHPSLSPDGKTVAYVSWIEQKEGAIVIQDVSGGRPLELAHGHSFWPPKWSPDGREILFSGRLRGRESHETYLVPRLGGIPRRYPYHSRLSWQPDGSAFVASSSDLRAVVTVDRSTGAETPVDPGTSFHTVWALASAPQTGRIAFCTLDLDGGHGFWIQPGKGQPAHRVLESGLIAYSPSWSRDGSALHFLQESRGSWNLMRLPIDPATGVPHGAPEILLTGLGSWDASFSADDRLVAYTSRTPRSNLWILRLPEERDGDARDPRALTRGTFAFDDCKFSPRGDVIAVSRSSRGGAEIHMIRPDDGAEEQITFLGSRTGGVCWSPDGRRVAFVSEHAGSEGIWIADSDGGNIHRLAERPMQARLTWAPGRRILCSRTDRKSLLWLDPDSGEISPIPLELPPGYTIVALPSPDQASLALYQVSMTEKGEGAWILPLDGSPPRELRPGKSIPVRWAPDGQSLWVFEDAAAGHGSEAIHAGERFRLLRIGIDSGEPPRQTVRLPFDRIAEVDVSPDGRQAVCNVAETVSDIWVVEDFLP